MDNKKVKALRVMDRFGFTFLGDSAVSKTPEANKRVFLALERSGFAVQSDEVAGPVWRLTDEGREKIADLAPVKR